MRKIAVIVLCTLFFLISCDSEVQVSLTQASQDTIIFSQLDTVYSHDKVLDALSDNDDLFAFCKSLGITQYKSANSINYTVLKTTNGMYLILADYNGAYVTMRQIIFSPDINRECVADLKAGMTLDNAKAADPDGQFDFLLHSSQNYPRISYHFFENGDCFSVKYEEDIIADIAYFTL